MIAVAWFCSCGDPLAASAGTVEEHKRVTAAKTTVVSLGVFISTFLAVHRRQNHCRLRRGVSERESVWSGRLDDCPSQRQNASISSDNHDTAVAFSMRHDGTRLFKVRSTRLEAASSEYRLEGRILLLITA